MFTLTKQSILSSIIITLSLLFASKALFADEDLSPNDRFDLSSYKGQFVYLDFWASWCGPCRASFPWMNSLQKDFKDKGLKVVSINLDSDRSDAKAFLNEFPANFDVIYDPEGKYAESYKLLGMPSSYFFNKDGELLFSHVGFNKKNAPKLREKILASLNQPQPLKPMSKDKN